MSTTPPRDIPPQNAIPLAFNTPNTPLSSIPNPSLFTESNQEYRRMQNIPTPTEMQHNEEKRHFGDFEASAGLPPLLKMKKKMNEDGTHEGVEIGGEMKETVEKTASAEANALAGNDGTFSLTSPEQLAMMPSTLTSIILDEHLHAQIDDVLQQLEHQQSGTLPDLQSKLIHLLLKLYKKQKQTLLLYLRHDIQCAVHDIQTFLRELMQKNPKVRQLFDSNNVNMQAFLLSTDEKDSHFTQYDLEERWESVIRFLEENPKMLQEIPQLGDPLAHILEQVRALDLSTVPRAAADFDFTIPQHLYKKHKDGKCIISRCTNDPMMCSEYCFKHILYDPKQQLYVPGRSFHDPRMCNEPLIPNPEFRLEFLRPSEEEMMYLQMMHEEQQGWEGASGDEGHASERTQSALADLLEPPQPSFPPTQQCVMFQISKSAAPARHVPENLKKRALDLIGVLEPASKRVRVE